MLPLLLIAGAAAFFFVGKNRSAATDAASGPAAGSAPSAVATVADTNQAAAFVQAPPLKRVIALYESESQRIGKVDPDPALTEKRLTGAAKDLRPEEIEWLGAQALDTGSEMDARFFAAYLTALAHSETAVGVLKKIALTPIPKSKNEMRMAEERVLRMQAVEGISRNCGLPSAKDDLLEIVAVEDEAIRDRAHRALYACQTGKRIEDGDREAIEKIQRKGK